MDRWFNVNEDARVWSGHSDNHQKMGWMLPGSAIRAINEYQGSYQFDEYKGPNGLFDRTVAYPQYWIRKGDVTLYPFEDKDGDDDNGDTETWPPPQDINVADAQLGAAFKVIGQWIMELLRSYRL